MKLLLASAAFMVISAASGAAAEKVCSFYCVSFFIVYYVHIICTHRRHPSLYCNCSSSSLMVLTPKNSKLKMIGCVAQAVQLKPGGTSKAENCVHMVFSFCIHKVSPPSSSIIHLFKTVQTTSNLDQGIVNGAVGTAVPQKMMVTNVPVALLVGGVKTGGRRSVPGLTNVEDSVQWIGQMIVMELQQVVSRIA